MPAKSQPDPLRKANHAPIRIGFDGSSTLGPRTGIGRAALELLRGLAGLQEEGLELRVLLNSLRNGPGPEHSFLRGPRTRVSRQWLPGPFLVGAWKGGWGPSLDRLVGPIDVALFPASYVAPAGNAPRAVIVHDLYFLDDPHDDNPLGAGYFRETFPRVLPQCAAIATPSEFVREHVLSAYDVDPDRVRAIPWAIDPVVFRPLSEVESEPVLRDLQLPSRYLLAVTAHSRRKRNALLLDAFSEAIEHVDDPIDLVVVGWNGEPARELVERAQLHPRVRVLPRVGDDALAAIYARATALLVPSAHEGFGLPVLEAMATGCPVIASRNSALAEVAGSAAAYADSDDASGWGTVVARLVNDPAQRSALRQQGISRAAEFSWRRTAESYLDLLRTATLDRTG